MREDDEFQKGPYTVNSLYLDTPELDDYRDKDGSLLIRKKMRVRMYENEWRDDLSRVWFEIKRKHNMNVAKRRVAVPGGVWRTFSRSGSVLPLLHSLDEPEQQRALDEFAYHYTRERYRPHVVVRYQRRAYLDTFLSTVRVTFDRAIEVRPHGAAYGDTFYMPVSQNLTVMEVKYNAKIPWYLTRALTQFDLQRTDFSKYRNAVAVLRGNYRIPIPK
jgi:hypothetical protein